MKIQIVYPIILIFSLFCMTSQAAVVSSSGTIVFETSPFPGESDTEVFVFDEQQGVSFVESQSLDFGSITAGTLVNSHYVQFDPESPAGFIDGGTITFDGIILGVVTSTAFLDQDLSADGAGSSDSYFGLADSLGFYPLGADPAARGLGSPEDDLLILLGINTLTIESLEIPNNPAVFGNLDGFRVFTSVVPVPAAAWLFGTALIGFIGYSRRRKIG